MPARATTATSSGKVGRLGSGATVAAASSTAMSDAPPHPQFCAWCGSSLAYEEHHHEARFETLAEQAQAAGEHPPPLPKRIEELMRGDSYIGACSQCRVLSHVISHHAQD